MNANPQGTNVLANEYLGFYLLSHLGFSVAPTRPVIVTGETIKKYPQLMFATSQGWSQPEGDLHLASEYIGRLPEYRVLDNASEDNEQQATNRGEFLGLYIFDVWASHQDKRQCIYRRHCKTRALTAYFIDNGHLFGGPAWTAITGPPRLFQRALLVTLTEDDSRIDRWTSYFAEEIPGLLNAAIERLPSAWYKGNLSELHVCLLDRLDNLKALVHADIKLRSRFLRKH